MTTFQKLNNNKVGFWGSLSAMVLLAYMTKNFAAVGYWGVMDDLETFIRYGVIFLLSLPPVIFGYFLLKKVGWIIGILIYAVNWCIAGILQAFFIIRVGHDYERVKHLNAFRDGNYLREAFALHVCQAIYISAFAIVGLSIVLGARHLRKKIRASAK